MDKEKIKLFSALVEEPSIYEIEVLDNSMLPDELKEREIIELKVRPPSLYTLSKCAIPVLKIPENIRNSEEMNLDKAIKYKDEMIEAIAIVAHGKSTEIPNWYIPFIDKNLTPKELYSLFIETVLKIQTDFFLSSFQSVCQKNPMVMM